MLDAQQPPVPTPAAPPSAAGGGGGGDMSLEEEEELWALMEAEEGGATAGASQQAKRARLAPPQGGLAVPLQCRCIRPLLGECWCWQRLAPIPRARRCSAPPSTSLPSLGSKASGLLS
jgi:hypothetical protein